LGSFFADGDKHGLFVLTLSPISIDGRFWFLFVINTAIVGLLQDLIARQLRDGSRLRLDGHVAVALSNIARMVTLNGIQDAMLDACLNANGLEAMPPPVTRCNILVGHHSADELADPILDTLQWAQHVAA
jgi:hypothetical protein